MKHNVLIITYYWPPSGGPGVQRYLKFSKYLPKFGIEPVILTVANPTYPIRDPSLEEEIPDSLKIYKSGTIEPFALYAGLSGKKAETVKPTVELKGKNLKSGIGSWIRANIFVPDARAGWLLTARKKAADIIRMHEIETVITTGPPHSVHFAGRYLQQKENIRWLADFRDPWSRVYYNQLLPRTSLAEQMDEKMEKTILTAADEVIVVSRSQAENFRKIVERGYRVITNGFDPDDFVEIDTNRHVAHTSSHENPAHPDGSINGPDQFVIRHIGNIAEAAIPVTLLNVIGELQQTVPVKLEFIGDVHPDLIRLTEQLNLQNSVHFQSYLPHRMALERMCGADALLLALPDVENIRHNIPGKMFEYLGSGRPILMIGPTDGDSAQILAEQKAGISCSFDDAGAIRKAILEMIRNSSSAGRTVDMKNHPFSRVTLTENLARLILSNADLK